MDQPPPSKIQNGLQWLLPGCARLKCHYEPRDIVAEASKSLPDNNDSECPRISVVVPSYNQGRFIGQTLESITEQKYPNLELIVVDGGSSDETVDIIRKHQNNKFFREY